MVNSFIFLVLLGLVLAPFLGILYSVADTWMSAQAVAETAEQK